MVTNAIKFGRIILKMDAGVNTVANVASLIKSIDSCEDIVKELAAPFVD